eukprot:snap_masked-scaffold_13-processed-gene-5.8-mRNA-1 protein AED:1.00 eAED:1.00 QI:0/0/0/0/1/1/2/0/102
MPTLCFSFLIPSFGGKSSVKMSNDSVPFNLIFLEVIPYFRLCFRCIFCADRLLSFLNLFGENLASTNSVKFWAADFSAGFLIALNGNYQNRILQYWLTVITV